MRELVVTAPFGTYRRGEHITDPATIAAVLAGEHAGCVVPVDAPDQPAKE